MAPETTGTAPRYAKDSIENHGVLKHEENAAGVAHRLTAPPLVAPCPYLRWPKLPTMDDSTRP